MFIDYKKNAEIDPLGQILCISTHIEDLTQFQYIIEALKLALWLQKLHHHVKVTLKSAKSDIWYAVYRQKRFVKYQISLLFLDLDL